MPQLIVYVTHAALGDDPLSDLTKAERVRETVVSHLDQDLQSQGAGHLSGTGMATIFTNDGMAMFGPFDQAAFRQAKAGEAALAQMGMSLGMLVTLAANFEVADFDDASTRIMRVLEEAGHADKLGIARPAAPAASHGDAPPQGQLDPDDVAAAYADMPPYKSIEIYYDISSIPEKYGHPLDFRNAAMELIEGALEEADAGEWSGAEIGMGEVNFGFEVEDFDLAEAIVRKTVKGTDFENIREITRYDSAEDS